MGQKQPVEIIISIRSSFHFTPQLNKSNNLSLPTPLHPCSPLCPLPSDDIPPSPTPYPAILAVLFPSIQTSAVAPATNFISKT